MSELVEDFENRKKDHIRIALSDRAQATSSTGLEKIHLVHEALPDIDFSEVETKTDFLGDAISPLFVSSMTAGHQGGVELNLRIAKACEKRNWIMGVGSQRRQINNGQQGADLLDEWKYIRDKAPETIMVGNIGVAQIINNSIEEIKKLVDSLEAKALFVHTNPLQEAFQPEGTPQFKGSFEALSNLTKNLNVPVILKETGCGFSKKTLKKINGIGLYAVDIAGLGGTHWGLVEGEREQKTLSRTESARVFSDWGESTVESLFSAIDIDTDYKVWASGGVRSGLDAAKLLAIGAGMVGFAKPIMEAALISEEKIIEKMEQFEFELRTAMFCSGVKKLADLASTENWTRV